MYFDFEDYRPDVAPLGPAISWREGVLLSVIAHLGAVIVMLLWPRLFPFDAEAARRRAEALQAQIPQEQTRFVFVQPQNDVKAPKAPPLAEPSDENRVSRSPEKAPDPNPMPFSRGNTAERVERADTPRGRGADPEPEAGPPSQTPTPPDPNPTRVPESQSAMAMPQEQPDRPDKSGMNGRAAVPGGLLGDAIKNLQRSMQSAQFNNPNGGGTFGPGIQFDTKGVEFGPWLRRFIEQVKRNWEPLIPPAAAYMKGHVVVTFNIHKDGSITDLTVAGPCPIDGFNNAAYGAMRASNPTYPLPPEYPSPQAFFTVTFFYNEQPPAGMPQ